MTRDATSKPLLAVLRGETLACPPVWLMRQAGRYLPEYRKVRAAAGSFLELCYTPELASEVTLQPVRRFGLDAAIIFSDILVVPDALGRDVRFVAGEGPILDALERVPDWPGEDAFLDHLGPVYRAVEQVAAALPEEVALIGFAGAPWTVAAYMIQGRGSRDFVEAKAWAMRNPAAFGKLLNLLVQATVVHLSAQVQAGAEVVQLFESWAGVVPEALFERWCIRPLAAIVAGLRARHGNVPVIVFARGAAPSTRDLIAKSGVDAIGIDSSVPVLWAARELQPHVAVQGNLDPVRLLTGGDVMAHEVAEIVHALGDGPFIFNLRHGILPQTPPEHVSELVALVRG